MNVAIYPAHPSATNLTRDAPRQPVYLATAQEAPPAVTGGLPCRQSGHAASAQLQSPAAAHSAPLALTIAATQAEVGKTTAISHAATASELLSGVIRTGILSPCRFAFVLHKDELRNLDFICTFICGIM